jgi:hypothetical protein
MNRARIFIVAAGVASLLGVVGIAYGAGAFDGAKPATAAFHDLDQAKAAGYTFRLPDLSGATCIDLPGVGGMGVHMVNTSLLDGTIDAEAPEALVYEEKNDGELKLAALEYVVFQGDWKGAQPPALFGREFDFVPAPNRFGLPSFYALHAWIWKPNPSGILSAWNPRVTCG